MSLLTTITIIGVAFLLTVALTPILIPLLKRMNFGQSIREEGLKSHYKKAGTPTMGAIGFIIAIVLSTIVLSSYLNLLTTPIIVLLIVFVGFGLIGFLDDFIKVVLKRNLGLTSKQKLVGQIFISIIAYFLIQKGPIDTTLVIPFTEWELPLGLLYVVFLVFWLVGFSNATNLTDGVDGLLSGTASIAFSAFGVLALVNSQEDLAIFAFSVTGALLGFLLFNINPAKVFMGDTGSLAIGGALAMLSILVKQELLLLLIGIVFVVETLSVILQVISFKTTGKRIFKISPIHHHFEYSGWSEWKIVVVFWLTALVAAIIAILPEVI
ncbi:phospho-N-acetylmuramoyl-pentapeptide-transferase [Paenisporosarcina cavernae]|uniref:Phospho-N-acetylmuramoyl-pentapeptide-transferase n=1 Tax=Paenisporosarcina cavernae TaxID=2320858 RepID=A0A385YS03_9BACL|nr:phospho-N-acetylmuramoyl-pentapeptide-transferase [Paenisporosarcina cavernae]AYC29160.1 phospho-N-acetylmuramoyl-pentapeptide-transferase [Paenisporosarcina cavernae]